MRRFLFILILLTFPSASFGEIVEDLPMPSKGDFEFFVDTATFSGLEARAGESYLEVYYVLDRRELAFIQGDNDRLWAHFQIEIELIDSAADTVVKKQSWENKTSAGSITEASKSGSLFNLSGFMLDPGRYKLWTKMTDLESGNTGSFEKMIEISEYTDGGLRISDLELAASVTESDTIPSKFDKSNFRVIPNPIRIYGPNVPILYFYAEIYNLVSDDGTYTVSYSVEDSAGNVYKVYPKKEKHKPGKTSVEVSAFNVISFPPAEYSLRVEVQDNSSGEIAASERSFRMGKPVPQPEARVQFTENMADQFADDMKYVATSQELKMYKELDLMGKARFIEKFWQKRDPTPDTPENEAMIKHYRQLAIAKSAFGYGNTEGPDTDRGRIFIVYGSPDDIERYPQSADRKPYEIWRYYSLQGGVQFIFVDLEGFGRYTLVHSTAENEVRDSDWERLISVY